MAKHLAEAGSTMDVKEVEKRLNISRETAINYIYGLRKRGLVETDRGKKGLRLYRIIPVRRKEKGFPGLYETINKYSPIKLVEPFKHRIYDHELAPEEAIVRAILTKDFRTILASLALFRKVSNWSLLYKFAKERKTQRFVGALYDLSRLCLRVRKMDRRIRNKMKSSELNTRYITPNVKSKDFQDIEREWNVFIPFNKGDIERYKR